MNKSFVMADVSLNGTIPLLQLDSKQLKMVLDKLNSDNKVLDEPAFTLIIVIYTILVSSAGDQNLNLF